MNAPDAAWTGDDILFDPPQQDETGPALAPPRPLRLTLEGDAQEILALLRAVVPPVADAPLRALRGRRPGQANLTPDVVRDIRARVARGEPKAAVARFYNICSDTVSDIEKRRTWKDVPD